MIWIGSCAQTSSLENPVIPGTCGVIIADDVQRRLATASRTRRTQRSPRRLQRCRSMGKSLLRRRRSRGAGGPGYRARYRAAAGKPGDDERRALNRLVKTKSTGLPRSIPVERRAPPATTRSACFVPTKAEVREGAAAQSLSQTAGVDRALSPHSMLAFSVGTAARLRFVRKDTAEAVGGAHNRDRVEQAILRIADACGTACRNCARARPLPLTCVDRLSDRRPARPLILDCGPRCRDARSAAWADRCGPRTSVALRGR